ncbi:MAG: T9SS type A sorting domain-containing protein [bacterium]
MKKSLFVLILCSISFLLFSFYNLSKRDLNELSGTRDIVLQFITYNGYGNNLYIDNIRTGTQNLYDINVTSFLNIPYDTIYSVQVSGSDTITPKVTVSNIGRGSLIDTITVFLNIEPGGYRDSAEVVFLNSGETSICNFNTFNYSIGTGYYLKAYTSYTPDSNYVNDTLNQYTVYLPGYTRNVLYEEFTSDSSFAAFNNDPALDAFVNQNIQTVTAIRYHLGILGRDTFYLANPEQADARRRYYYVSSVPTTFADGLYPVSIPYGDSLNLYGPYFRRLSKGSPLTMTVTDERISGDSIRATIDLNIISSPPQGNYKLRINAVERNVNDTQGLFVNFYDIFRAAYPDTNGISIAITPGTSQYQYTYYRQPGWVDSMIYTAAFIQNDNNREVLNCAKGRNIVLENVKSPKKLIYEKSQPLNVNYTFKKSPPVYRAGDSIQTALNIELFEAYFPPINWKIFNQDGFITFSQFTGANGPTIGGTKSVQMNFFDYNIPGQKDSMYSKAYTNLLTTDTLRFDYSYAQYGTSYVDSLIVNVSTDGGLTFPMELFRKGGQQLATAPQTTSYFVPQNNTQWKTYSTTLSNVVSVNNYTETSPDKFNLQQNYPNPFNPETVINYELPVTDFVTLKVFDILGKEILTLVNQKQTAGAYSQKFNGSNLPSGIYFYQLKTQGFSDTKRMVLVK